MELYHIVATSGGGVIGKDNRLPWHSPSDLKRFKKITIKNTVIMGMRTFESLSGRPLPDRENFILTHSSPVPQEKEHLKFFNSLDEALKNVTTERAFIIGGADLFQQTLHRIDGIYLTVVQGDYQGDAYYPVHSPDELEKLGFKVISRETSSEDPKLEFIELRRNKK